MEVAHIDSWEKVQEHRFENLIALCPTCHTRYDRGDIDRQSMLHYKANLSLLSSRYGEYERRIIEVFVANPGQTEVQLPSDPGLLMMYLLSDGIVENVSHPQRGGVFISGVAAQPIYRLTTKGSDLVERIRSAQEVE